MKRLILLLLTSLFCITTFAQYDEKPVILDEHQSANINFDKLDGNKDGIIDVEEAKADNELDEVFAAIATQGKLSREKYIEWYVTTMQ